MIKKTMATFAFMMALFLLVSCGPAMQAFSGFQSSPATSQTAESLNFRITWESYSGRGEAIQKIVDSYNTENTSGLSVSMISGDEDLAAIETILQAPNPHTVFVLPYRYVKYFGAKGYLADQTNSFANEKKLFYPALWELGTVDDAVYGIPWLGHSMCLLYNKTLLNETGFNPESIKSLDSWVAAMDAVEAKTGAKGVGLVGAESNDISWMVNQFVYGFGSALVDNTGMKVAVNNDKAKAAIEFYRDTLGELAQPTWKDDTGSEVMSQFLNQKVAFEFQGIWGVTDIEKNGSPFEVGIIPLSNIGLCSEVGPMMLAFPAKMSEEYKRAAIDFINYMISIPAQDQIMDGEYSPEHDIYYPFRTPIRLDMADSEFFTSNPKYVSFLSGFENPSIDVPVPAWQTVKDRIYAPGLHRVMVGELTVDDFLSDVETEGNKLLSAG